MKEWEHSMDGFELPKKAYTHEDAMRRLDFLMACIPTKGVAEYDARGYLQGHIERLEAENAQAKDEILAMMRNVKRVAAERNEWEAVARWLASRHTYGTTEMRLKEAQEAVRHE